jgi:hypothetical protein
MAIPKARLVLPLVLLVLIALMTVVAPVSAQSYQNTPPTLTCPVGYAPVAAWRGDLLANETDGPFNFVLAQPSQLLLDVWSGVGHPEAGCAFGSGNDGGSPCDQGQTVERYQILIDGSTLFTTTDGFEDTYLHFGHQSGGTLSAGTHTIRFHHLIQDYSNVTPESVFYFVKLCARPIPRPGGEGCTPGYWKQPQHLDSWVGYTPSQSFSSVFGVSYGGTLLQALDTGGGGARALGRHAVAALLNAANPDVSYAYTTSQVIALVQQAFATGNYEYAKNLLERENQRGCPLN